MNCCVFSFIQFLYPLTSVFTVLEEEVKRAEMWKLTCQEHGRTDRSWWEKAGKVRQRDKNLLHWAFVSASESLGFLFGNVFNQGNKNMSEMQNISRSPYPLLEIVLWLNPQETAEARQWASHNEILKSERGKASVWSPVVRNLFTVFWIKGKEVSWQERGKGRKGVGGGRVTGMLEQKTFKNKIP